jgi:hypothetical protein
VKQLPRFTLPSLALLLVVFEVGRSLGRPDRVIFTGYTQVGEVVLQGGTPYDLWFNTWPPFFQITAAGLALAARVSATAALLLWQVGAVFAIWGSCRILARFLEEDGATLTFWPRAQGHLSFASSAVAVPVLMTGRLILDHLQHTQINLYLLFLVLLAFHLFREGRVAWGAGALALAASLKAVPVLFVAYLVYRRRWRETLWTLGVLVVLNAVVPVALFGPGEAAEHWHAWRAVASAQVGDPTPRFANQSLLAALKRLVTTEGGARDPVRYAVAAWSPEAVRSLFIAVVGLAGLGLALAFRGPGGDLRDRRSAVEIALCVGLLPIVSPLGWKAQYSLLVAPYWVVWWGLRHGAVSGRAAWVVWWLSFACLTLSAESIVGRGRVRVLESLNVILVGGLLVVGLALWVRARMSRDPTPPPRPPGASSAAPPSPSFPRAPG